MGCVVRFFVAFAFAINNGHVDITQGLEQGETLATFGVPAGSPCAIPDKRLVEVNH